MAEKGTRHGNPDETPVREGDRTEESGAMVSRLRRKAKEKETKRKEAKGKEVSNVSPRVVEEAPRGTVTGTTISEINAEASFEFEKNVMHR